MCAGIRVPHLCISFGSPIGSIDPLCMGTFRVPDRGSLNASPLGDGWAALASFRPLVVFIDYAGEFLLPPGEAQDEGI